MYVQYNSEFSLHPPVVGEPNTPEPPALGVLGQSCSSAAGTIWQRWHSHAPASRPFPTCSHSLSSFLPLHTFPLLVPATCSPSPGPAPPGWGSGVGDSGMAVGDSRGGCSSGAIPDWVLLTWPLGILIYSFIVDSKKQHQPLTLRARSVLLCHRC